MGNAVSFPQKDKKRAATYVTAPFIGLVARATAAAAVVTVCAAATSTVEQKHDDDYPDYPFATAAAIITKEHKKAPFKIQYLY